MAKAKYEWWVVKIRGLAGRYKGSWISYSPPWTARSKAVKEFQSVKKRYAHAMRLGVVEVVLKGLKGWD